MANLVVDIGNSRNKFAIFIDRKLQEIFTDLTFEDIETLIIKFKISHSILSSVKSDSENWEDLLRMNTSFLKFSTQLKTTVNINYKTPGTLGQDRLAALIGAVYLYPNRKCLVIDAGTCITYDAVDRDRNYFGGSISPGLKMRLQAMHSFTGRLPLINLDENFSAWQGNDTTSAMLSGVVNGAGFELMGFTENYNLKYTNLQIILCGGDSNIFDTRLKSSIFAQTFKTEANLVLIGLNEVIHQYND